MSEVVAAFAANVPPPCRAGCCERDGCSVDLVGCSARRAIVDMDCLVLPIPEGQRRCDYIFVGEEDDTTWVVPIELKSGTIRTRRLQASESPLGAASSSSNCSSSSTLTPSFSAFRSFEPAFSPATR